MIRRLDDCDVVARLDLLYERRDVLWRQHVLLNQEISALEEFAGVK